MEEDAGAAPPGLDEKVMEVYKGVGRLLSRYVCVFLLEGGEGGAGDHDGVCARVGGGPGVRVDAGLRWRRVGMAWDG